MNTSKKLMISAGIVMILSVQALAQGGPVMSQCASEIAQYCADKDHGAGAVRTCLEENRTNLSSSCRQALDTTGGGVRSGMAMMSTDEIAEKLKQQGYGEISKIEAESGKRYEVKTVDANGNRVELYVDGITGEILRSERDD
ncbi:MAG: hypothetical protein HKP56_16075 [Anderseniella sp.]|jgi:uncharacterized membrane protein YkoI|nr:hypothetical protein [Anderseniella sp.]